MKKVLAIMPDKSADLNLADYLNFLAANISIEAVNSLHIFTANHLFQHLNEAGDDYGSTLLKRIKETMEKELDGAFQEIPNKQVEVVAGKTTIAEIIRKGYHSTFDLMALGEHDKSDTTLAKQIIRHVPGNALFVPEKAAKKLSHILVPVDLSEHSAKILAVAIGLSQLSAVDLKITCYHSFEVPTIASVPVIQAETQFIEVVKQNNYKALHQFVDEQAGENRSAVNEVVQEQIASRPDKAILNYAMENGVDLIIMGTSGHSIIDAWLGSTVERVISQNDSIPMLIIK